MATRISQAAAAAALDAVVDRLDADASPGFIEIRTGAQPATVATAASGTLLGTLTLSATAFGNATVASPSVATAAAITDDSSADATGTAGWFRAYDGAAVAIDDGDITATGGGGDMELDNINIVAGGVIAVSSWTISMPNGD